MSKRVLLNVRTFAGGVDLTAASNKWEWASQVEAKDVTNFASQGWKEHLGGLGTSDLSGAGQWEAGSASLVDDAMWAGLGAVTNWSMYEDSAAVGTVGYLVNALESEYKQGGTVGDVAPWEAKVVGSGVPVRGVSLQSPGTPVTVTGVGTSVQHVAVGATQRLYASLHVLSVSGTSTPTITVRVESDTATGFPSPTTVLTFAPATAIGGQLLSAPGPITDTWFRVGHTVSGTTPSFLYLVTIGVR